MNQTYKAVVIVINASGDSDAITIDVPDTFEKCSAEERDYIEEMVINEGYDFLTYFSTESELDTLSYALNKAMPETSRKVRHWNHAELPHDIPVFQMDVSDERLRTGQLFVDLGPENGNVDDCLHVSIEVTTIPDGTHTQAVHIALDNGDNVISLFKQADKLILEPNGRLILDEIEHDQARRAYLLSVE